MLVVALTSLGCGPAEVSPDPAAAPAPPSSAVPPASIAAPPPIQASPAAPAPGERPWTLATAAACVTLREAKVLERMFSGGDLPPRLVGEAGLTAAGQRVADTLAAVAEEGLDPAGYALDRLPPLAEAYTKARAAVLAEPKSEPARAALATARACWEVALFDGLVTYLRDGRLGNPATAERLAIRALTESEPAEEAEGAVAERGGGASERPGEATLPPFTVPAGVPLPPVLRDRAEYVTSQQIVEALRACGTPRAWTRCSPAPCPRTRSSSRCAPRSPATGDLERAGGFSPPCPTARTIKPARRTTPCARSRRGWCRKASSRVNRRAPTTRPPGRPSNTSRPRGSSS
jgi:hypothetical protein